MCADSRSQNSHPTRYIRNVRYSATYSGAKYDVVDGELPFGAISPRHGNMPLIGRFILFNLLDSGRRPDVQF